ncbi:MAG: nucleotide sugar dehydrogenase [Thermodesulfobacteriota bacterium]
MVDQYISEEFTELIARIRAREAVVGIIGLGYVGLPLAIHFCRSGFKVIGFDVDDAKIDSLAQGCSYIRHIPDNLVRELSVKAMFEATSDFDRLAEPDCLLICVTTPLDGKMEPDLSYLLQTTGLIAKSIRDGQLIVLESTTYPGTTEEMLLPKLESSSLKVGRDFFLAFSPEREDPGNKNFDASNIPKIVGGVTPACLEVATALYNAITKAVPVSSTRAAELTKLLENTYRSVNIALVNEMKILAHRMDIDLFEVINAAATKPFGYTPFFPGPGLGGHCIPIDPFYFAWKAKEYDFDARFIHLAGEVNIAMPEYVVERTAKALVSRGKELQGSYILVLGIAYKKDIDDDRESPGYAIMDMLTDRGALVSYNDPWIAKLRPTRKYNFTQESVELTPELLTACDAVIIVTDHTAYDYGEIVSQARLVVDTRNATAGLRKGLDKVVLA